MACFDPARQEVVVTIVYDGSGGSGKTTNVYALRKWYGHASRGEVVTPAATSRGGTLFFDWLRLEAGQLDEHPLRCEVLSVPGQLVYSARRYGLLRRADAVVQVCDSRPRALARAVVGARYLLAVLDDLGRPDLPVVVQANQQDAKDALEPARLARALRLPDHVRVLPACALRGEGVRETFMAALALAREKTRGRVRSDGAAALPAPPSGCEALLRELEEETRDGAVLDRVLSEST